MKSNEFTKLDGSGLKIAIIGARFNQKLTDALVADCEAALTACSVSQVTTVRVPGSFELPIAAEKLAATKKYDAIIALGVIIKGDTKHDHYIADAVANGLTNVALKHQTPTIFGVLTTENLEQAEVRSLGGQKKGYEAGMSAVETVKNLQLI